MLPKIDIQFTNGQLGGVRPIADGLAGMVASAVATGQFELNRPYKIKSIEDVARLGIVPDTDNYNLYHALRGFYDQAGAGTELWLMGRDKSEKVSDWFTPDAQTGKAPVETLLDKAGGKIKFLFTKYAPPAGTNVQVSNGMDADVMTAAQRAHQLAVDYTQRKYAPFFTVLEAYAFTGQTADLPDLTQYGYNRVAIVAGNVRQASEPEGRGAATEVLAARLARIKVSENAGKVRLGALAVENIYIGDTEAVLFDVASLHDKGYISFRTHTGKAGYYFTDDPLATSPADDYSHITRRRVIDKAYRIAYDVLSEYMLDDFTLDNDGSMNEIYAASIEGRVESAIYAQMTLEGELSANPQDPKDLGVRAKIDTDTSVIETGRVNMTLKVRPKGILRWLEVQLGFDVNLNE